MKTIFPSEDSNASEKDEREVFHIFHNLTSIPTTPAKKPPAPPKVCKSKSIKAKLKEELNAINSIVIQRWVMGKDRNTTRGTAEKKVRLVHLAL